MRPGFAGSIAAGAIMVVSLANTARPARDFLRRRPIQQDPLSAHQRELLHAKSVVNGLGVEHLAYFDEEPGWQTIEAVGEYYAVQYAVAPAILRRDSQDDRFALVNFRLSHKPTPQQGYTFMEELGAGLALYQKP
jgi:hypothetical protein